MLRAQKRDVKAAVSFDELNDCIAEKGRVYENIEAEELKNIIESFHKNQNDNVRNIFICRYFYGDFSFELYESKDFPSSQMVSFGDKDFFLVIDIQEDTMYNALLGCAEVVIVDSKGSFITKKLFSDFSKSVLE